MEAAEAGRRVVLTADRAFARARHCPTYLLCQGLDRRQQLHEVLSAFGMTVGRHDLLSRCASCNGSLGPRPLAVHELPPGAAAQVPPALLERKGMEFWMCSSAEACGKVYWQGIVVRACVYACRDVVGRCV